VAVANKGGGPGQGRAGEDLLAPQTPPQHVCFFVQFS